MFSPPWRKVGRDLWGNKSRTLLVVLSIAVGVFAVGLIAGTQAVLFRDMNASFLASNPAHAVLFADPNNADDPDKPAELFDDELVQAVRRMDIAVFSVRASMLHTLDEALQYWNYDLSVDFDRPQTH